MHAIVIGAGPGGSLTAILLARRGVRVTLVEQHVFPRDKVCGECISALGRFVLQTHGLETPLAEVGVALLRTRLATPDHAATIPLPEPMLGVSRARLDSHLLAAARDAGVDVLQPARVEAIGNQTARVRFLRDNRLQDIAADHIVLADGRRALLGERPALTGDMGIKAHFVDVQLDPEAITLFSGDASYGGAAPVEGGRWNVAFSVPATLLRRHTGDLDAVFRQITRAHTAMREAFGPASRLGEWLASPLPRYSVPRAWPNGIVPVGNAACAIEPIGGEGMGLALRSAELAADSIVDGEVDRLPERYRSLWKNRSRFCRLGGLALSSDRLASACVAMADTPALARVGLRLIGK